MKKASQDSNKVPESTRHTSSNTRSLPGNTPADSASGRLRTAAAGLGNRAAARSLPHESTIQRAFGHHDVSGVRAQVGGEAGRAAESLGARAYTYGDQIAFRRPPTLRTAAHEATHVVQQRGGLKLPGGQGRAGDVHERQAARVADAVVAGRSAVPLLEGIGAGHGSSTALQLDEETHQAVSNNANQAKPEDEASQQQTVEDWWAAWLGALERSAPRWSDEIEGMAREAMRMNGQFSQEWATGIWPKKASDATEVGKPKTVVKIAFGASGSARSESHQIPWWHDAFGHDEAKQLHGTVDSIRGLTEFEHARQEVFVRRYAAIRRSGRITARRWQALAKAGWFHKFQDVPEFVVFQHEVTADLARRSKAAQKRPLVLRTGFGGGIWWADISPSPLELRFRLTLHRSFARREPHGVKPASTLVLGISPITKGRLSRPLLARVPESWTTLVLDVSQSTLSPSQAGGMVLQPGQRGAPMAISYTYGEGRSSAHNYREPLLGRRTHAFKISSPESGSIEFLFKTRGNKPTGAVTVRGGDAAAFVQGHIPSQEQEIPQFTGLFEQQLSQAYGAGLLRAYELQMGELRRQAVADNPSVMSPALYQRWQELSTSMIVLPAAHLEAGVGPSEEGTIVQRASERARAFDAALATFNEASRHSKPLVLPKGERLQQHRVEGYLDDKPAYDGGDGPQRWQSVYFERIADVPLADVIEQGKTKEAIALYASMSRALDAWLINELGESGKPLQGMRNILDAPDLGKHVRVAAVFEPRNPREYGGVRYAPLRIHVWRSGPDTWQLADYTYEPHHRFGPIRGDDLGELLGELKYSRFYPPGSILYHVPYSPWTPETVGRVQTGETKWYDDVAAIAGAIFAVGLGLLSGGIGFGASWAITSGGYALTASAITGALAGSGGLFDSVALGTATPGSVVLNLLDIAGGLTQLGRISTRLIVKAGSRSGAATAALQHLEGRVMVALTRLDLLVDSATLVVLPIQAGIEISAINALPISESEKRELIFKILMGAVAGGAMTAFSVVGSVQELSGAKTLELSAHRFGDEHSVLRLGPEGDAVLTPASGLPQTAVESAARADAVSGSLTAGEALEPHRARALRDALPPKLADEVPIVASQASDVSDITVRVAYGDGALRLEVGPTAKAHHVAAHVGVLRILRKYEGPWGKIRRRLRRLGHLIGVAERYGSAGFEAKLELQKLNAIRKELRSQRQLIEHRLDTMGGQEHPDAQAVDQEVGALNAELADIDARVDDIKDQLAHHRRRLGSDAEGVGHIDALGEADTARLRTAKRPLDIFGTQKQEARAINRRLLSPKQSDGLKARLKAARSSWTKARSALARMPDADQIDPSTTAEIRHLLDGFIDDVDWGPRALKHFDDFVDSHLPTRRTLRSADGVPKHDARAYAQRVLVRLRALDTERLKDVGPMEAAKAKVAEYRDRPRGSEAEGAPGTVAGAVLVLDEAGNKNLKQRTFSGASRRARASDDDHDPGFTPSYRDSGKVPDARFTRHAEQHVLSKASEALVDALGDAAKTVKGRLVMYVDHPNKVCPACKAGLLDDLGREVGRADLVGPFKLFATNHPNITIVVELPREQLEITAGVVTFHKVTKPAAPVVQRLSNTLTHPPEDPLGIARAGVRGVGRPLPFLDTIQRSFGHHDLSGVTAHLDPAARHAGDQLGARAYATDGRVAFAEPPSLHTAAHEAAHIVQQRRGVDLDGSIGAPDDRYERQANVVADAVVQGRDASGLLASGSPGARPAVQLEPTAPAVPYTAPGAVARPSVAEILDAPHERLLRGVAVAVDTLTVEAATEIEAAFDRLDPVGAVLAAPTGDIEQLALSDDTAALQLNVTLDDAAAELHIDFQFMSASIALSTSVSRSIQPMIWGFEGLDQLRRQRGLPTPREVFRHLITQEAVRAPSGPPFSKTDLRGRHLPTVEVSKARPAHKVMGEVPWRTVTTGGRAIASVQLLDAVDQPVGAQIARLGSTVMVHITTAGHAQAAVSGSARKTLTALFDRWLVIVDRIDDGGARRRVHEATNLPAREWRAHVARYLHVLRHVPLLGDVHAHARSVYAAEVDPAAAIELLRAEPLRVREMPVRSIKRLLDEPGLWRYEATDVVSAIVADSSRRGYYLAVRLAGLQFGVTPVFREPIFAGDDVDYAMLIHPEQAERIRAQLRTAFTFDEYMQLPARLLDVVDPGWRIIWGGHLHPDLITDRQRAGFASQAESAHQGPLIPPTHGQWGPSFEVIEDEYWLQPDELGRRTALRIAEAYGHRRRKPSWLMSDEELKFWVYEVFERHPTWSAVASDKRAPDEDLPPDRRTLVDYYTGMQSLYHPNASEHAEATARAQGMWDSTLYGHVHAERMHEETGYALGMGERVGPLRGLLVDPAARIGGRVLGMGAGLLNELVTEVPGRLFAPDVRAPTPATPAQKAAEREALEARKFKALQKETGAAWVPRPLWALNDDERRQIDSLVYYPPTRQEIARQQQAELLQKGARRTFFENLGHDVKGFVEGVGWLLGFGESREEAQAKGLWDKAGASFATGWEAGKQMPWQIGEGLKTLVERPADASHSQPLSVAATIFPVLRAGWANRMIPRAGLTRGLGAAGRFMELTERTIGTHSAGLLALQMWRDRLLRMRTTWAAMPPGPAKARLKARIEQSYGRIRGLLGDLSAQVTSAFARSKAELLDDLGGMGAANTRKFEGFSPKADGPKPPDAEIGRQALLNSDPIKGNPKQRVGFDLESQTFVVFDQTQPATATKGARYVGEPHTWKELTKAERKTLIDTEEVTKSGKIIGVGSTLEQRTKPTRRGQFGDNKQRKTAKWSEGEGTSVLEPRDIPANKGIRDLLKARGQTGVSYKGTGRHKPGEPDFRPFKHAEVELEATKLKGMVDQHKRPRGPLHAHADERLAQQWNSAGKDGKTNWTGADVKAYRKQNKLTWHEEVNMKFMLLIPTKVNSWFKHFGGIGEAEKILGKK